MRPAVRICQLRLAVGLGLIDAKPEQALQQGLERQSDSACTELQGVHLRCRRCFAKSTRRVTSADSGTPTDGPPSDVSGGKRPAGMDARGAAHCGDDVEDWQSDEGGTAEQIHRRRYYHNVRGIRTNRALAKNFLDDKRVHGAHYVELLDPNPVPDWIKFDTEVQHFEVTVRTEHFRLGMFKAGGAASTRSRPRGDEKRAQHTFTDTIEEADSWVITSWNPAKTYHKAAGGQKRRRLINEKIEVVEEILFYAVAERTAVGEVVLVIYFPPRRTKQKNWDEAHVQESIRNMLQKWDEMWSRGQRMVLFGDVNHDYCAWQKNARGEVTSEPFPGEMRNFNSDVEGAVVRPVMRWICRNMHIELLDGPTYYGTQGGEATEPAALDMVAHVGYTDVSVDRVLIKPTAEWEIVEEQTPEQVRQFTKDHLALYVDLVWEEDAQRPTEDAGAEKKLADAKQQSEPLTKENFLGRYEDYVVPADSKWRKRVKSGGQTLLPKTDGDAAKMKRADESFCPKETVAALHNYRKKKEPPRTDPLELEKWLRDALADAGLITIKQRKDEEMGPRAVPSGVEEKQAEETKTAARRRRREEKREKATGSLTSWGTSGGMDTMMASVLEEKDQTKQKDDMFKVAAGVRSATSGKKKGEPLPQLDSIDTGTRTINGPGLVAEEVLLTHILKPQIMHDGAGVPFDAPAATWDQARRQLADAVKACAPYRITDAEVREFLRGANSELQGQLGIRMKVYKAFGPFFIRVYVDCANAILQKIENTHPDRWACIVPAGLRVLLVELLGKGGEVKTLKKIRTITKGAPALRIQAGCGGAEIMRLAEKNNQYDLEARGGRAKMAVAVSNLQLVDSVDGATDPKTSTVLLGVDNSNYFNCESRMLMSNILRGSKPHPTALAYFMTVNENKFVALRNGAYYATTIKHNGIIQGTCEAMLTGTIAQVRTARAERLFLLYCYNPNTRRLDRERIIRAKAALIKDMEQDTASLSTEWTHYDYRQDVDPVYHLPKQTDSERTQAGMIAGPAVADYRDRKATPFLDGLHVNEKTLPPHETGRILMCVDDKVIAFAAHDDDFENGNITLIVQALRRKEVHGLRKVSQFVAASKFELVMGRLSWTPTQTSARMEKWKQVARAHFFPFNLQPKVKTSTMLLGLLLDMTQSAADTLWSQMCGRLATSRTQAELVLEGMKRLDGVWLRTLILWAFYSPVVHLLPVAVRCFSSNDWRHFCFDVAWAVLRFIGFTDDRVKYLMKVNAIQRHELYKLVFGAEVVNAHDPKILGTKIMRTTSANALALLNDHSLLRYVVWKLSPGNDAGGFNEEDLEVFADIRGADKRLMELAAVETWKTNTDSQETKPETDDGPLLIPHPAKCDYGRYHLVKMAPQAIDMRRAPPSDAGQDRKTNVLELVWNEDSERLLVLAGSSLEFEIHPEEKAHCECPGVKRRAILRKVTCMTAALRRIWRDCCTAKHYRHIDQIFVHYPQTLEIMNTGTCAAFWGACAVFQEQGVISFAGTTTTVKRPQVVLWEKPTVVPEAAGPRFSAKEEKVQGLCEVAGRDVKIPKRSGYAVFFDFKEVKEKLSIKEWREAVQKAYAEDKKKREEEARGGTQGEASQLPLRFEEVPQTQDCF